MPPFSNPIIDINDNYFNFDEKVAKVAKVGIVEKVENVTKVTKVIKDIFDAVSKNAPLKV